MIPGAFLFDMDGLLLDSERVYAAVARDLLVPLGFDPAAVDAHFLGLVGVSGPAARALISGFVGPRVDAARFDRDRHAEVARRLAREVPVRPTVRESLDRLGRLGARMAVVTSTDGDTARAHLGRAGLLAHFEAVLGGNEARARKPDPAPYLQAAEVLGVTPRDCAAFEDSDSGIAAAVGAGCVAVQVPDLRPAGKPPPDLGQKIAPDLRAAIDAVGGFAPPARRRRPRGNAAPAPGPVPSG